MPATHILAIALLALGVLGKLGAALIRPKRWVLFWGAQFALWGAVAAYYNAFWAVCIFGLMSIATYFCATNYIDFAWRVKTAFVLFLALGAGIAIYPTYHDERFGKPEVPAGLEGAEQETKAKQGHLGFSRYVLANIPFRLVRGLDLKGGLRLVYTVEVDKAIEDKRDRYYDELRHALTKAFGFQKGDKAPTLEELAKLPTKVKIEKSREQAGVIKLTLVDPADASKINDEFLKKFLQELHVQRSQDRSQITFRINSQVESQIREHAVTQAKETVLKRVDTLGLKEASISVRDEDIVIEIPGDDEKAFREIKDTVSQTARLEFKMVDDNVDYFDALSRTKEEDLPKGLKFEAENAPVGPGKTKVVHFARLIKAPKEDLGSALKRLREWTSTLQVDSDHEVGVGRVQDYNEETGQIEDVGWRTYYLYSKAEITGDMVRDARAQADQSERGMNGWAVHIDLSPVGADRFEEVTGRNVMRRFAIVLDSKVESAPRILGKIAGGQCQITMGSSNPEQQLAEANKLQIVLRSGALPAPISPSYEQRIGPSLGKDAIAQGFKGGVASALLVIIFMVAYYSRAGMIANIAVLFNVVLQIAVLAMFGASMTLPGIAGLSLTIGIAVDANVLINERIREELRLGKSPRAAVDAGYDKAFSAIVDGHVTTLISSIILWQYGSGPIKGFAVTLFFGVLVSLFTGVFCTRLMFDWAVRGRKIKKLYLG